MSNVNKYADKVVFIADSGDWMKRHKVRLAPGVVEDIKDGEYTEYDVIMMSVRKWDMLAKSEHVPNGITGIDAVSCALCVDNDSTPPDEVVCDPDALQAWSSCLSCPVYEKTGEFECKYTPFYRAQTYMKEIMDANYRIAFGDTEFNDDRQFEDAVDYDQWLNTIMIPSRDKWVRRFREAAERFAHLLLDLAEEVKDE